MHEGIALLLWLLLFWLVATLSLSRARALQLAKQATAVRAAETLREQLDFIQQLIETVPQPIFFKDARGAYLGCNAAFERCLGTARGDLVGRTVFDVAPPDLARVYHEADVALLQSGGTQIYEARVQWADGTRRDVVFHRTAVMAAPANAQPAQM